MAEPQTSSLTQINAEFAQAKATRLDTAITKALASKLPPAPKAARGTAGAAASTAPSGTVTAPLPAPATPTATLGSSPEPAHADGVDPPSAEELGLDPGVATEPEPQDGAAEGQGGPDPELLALAKRKDLRALEKRLGLEEGILGAANGDFAALRRQQDKVAALRAEVEAKHESNNAALIGKFGPIHDLAEHARKGDLRAYAALVERTTGIRIAAFVQHYSQNIPQMSARELHLEQENARLRGATAPTAASDPSAPVTKEAALTRANAYLQGEAKDHPALLLRGGLDEVRTKWLSAFKNGQPGLSPKQAADAVVLDRKRAHENEQWILSGKQRPPAPTTKTLSRTGASETQVRKQSPKSREQLITEGAEMVKRQKAADAARQRR